ncbi:S9 family peptidase [Paenibacillus cremeus]|uniref:S9 family peptidase n=1 Tax=Paenibacillus cremeus TaxID=2163881 RepID=A0A559K0K1_9BACL|nr:prolyl oligopeptidase family serine peptidase [Paenibacillus cremeus]TVY05692.1 S9 family peptidase [Paenibacillus cremeus]
MSIGNQMKKIRGDCLVRKKSSSYGSWVSPLTSELITTQFVELSGPSMIDGSLFWAEGRPLEGGRVVVVCRTADGREYDVIPASYNVRSRVYEYGGGASVFFNGYLYFSNFEDNLIYKQPLSGEGKPVPITTDSNLRYADLVIDEARNRLICVREDHRQEGEPTLSIVALDCNKTGEGDVLVEGADFYLAPQISLDGKRMCWLAWNFPIMPWDGTELWMAEVLEDGRISSAFHVAGNEKESIFQPMWHRDGSLYFSSDKTDWWNIYRYSDGQIQQITNEQVDFGLCNWQCGTSMFTFFDDDTIVSSYAKHSLFYLGWIDIPTGRLRTQDTPYTFIGSPIVYNGKILLNAACSTTPHRIISLHPNTGEIETLVTSNRIQLNTDYLSTATVIDFPSRDGWMSHGLYYPPTNRDFEGGENELPPLLITVHGGPTGMTSPGFRWDIQYYTSRGFAVLDVNYRGSTSYGRSYRDALNNNWGTADVEDCVAGALYLANTGKVDRRRLAITGGSAGGYTTLSSLAFSDVFAVGGCHFGISDCELWAKETHKFERRYLDGLIGELPGQLELYHQRSASHALERYHSPLIMFHGLEDKVVPPNQAQIMADGLKSRGLPVSYLTFEGEGHGFLRAENLRRALDEQFLFFSCHLAFDPS